MIGTITKIQKKTGRRSSYGFLESDGENYYFQLQEPRLKVGMKVNFKGGKNEKGGIATEIHPLDS